MEHRPEDKNLLQLLPGIFISTRGYPTDRDIQNELDITAAAVKHPQSVVIGQSAAFLHGLARTTEQLAQKDPIPVDLGFRTHAIPSTRKHGSIRIRSHRITQAELDRSVLLRTRFGEVRVASVADTCLQLALWHPLDSAVVAVEDALSRKRLRRGEVKLERLQGRKGANRARKAFNLVTPWSESPRETELKLRLWGAGLPAPMQQVDIRRHTGELLGRVDFMYSCGLIVEYDGVGKHVSDSVDLSDVFLMERTLHAERERERRIMALGYRFVRVDRRNFRDGTGVEAVAETLADMLKYPPSAERTGKWLWSAKGKAWREKGDPGWLPVR